MSGGGECQTKNVGDYDEVSNKSNGTIKNQTNFTGSPLTPNTLLCLFVFVTGGKRRRSSSIRRRRYRSAQILWIGPLFQFDQGARGRNQDPSTNGQRLDRY